jgi:DNA excision repair protein ERCC-2
MISTELRDMFPYSTIRDGQSELVSDIQKAVERGHTLIAHAPTGLGKTASVLTVALQYALQHKKRVFFLTNRHTQHHIAIETLQLMKEKAQFSCVDLIGKRWMCNQEIAGLFGTDFHEFCRSIVEKGECEYYNNVKQKNKLQVEAKALMKEIRAPLHNEQLLQVCRERKMCSYEIALEMAKTADVIIGDYYYIFNPHVQKSLLQKLDVAMEDVILVVDEGHNLPSRVRDMVSSNLTNNMLKNAIIEAKKFGYNGLISWLQHINSVLNNLAVFDREKECLVKKEDFIDAITVVVEYSELLNQLELAAEEVRKKQRKSALGGVIGFLESWQGKDDGATRILAERESRYGTVLMLSYLCLDPSRVTEEIFNQIHSGVVMSGTLQPTFMYKDILGISKSMEREYSSPFPPENKLSMIVPETTTKFTARNEAMYDAIAERSQQMADLIPGNVALFFPSYHLRDTVCRFLKTEKELFWEKREMTKEEKEVFLSQFKEAKNGLLLAVTGANFAEGIDFPGDVLQGVVVIGLPLAKPSLFTKEIIAYYQEKFGKGWEYGYTFPAMSKCIQSAGRCIRSETDRGVVIYLDQRFAWERYYNCLPREGLMVTKEWKKRLEEFFK